MYVNSLFDENMKLFFTIESEQNLYELEVDRLGECFSLHVSDCMFFYAWLNDNEEV